MFALYSGFLLLACLQLFRQGEMMGCELLPTKPTTGFGNSHQRKKSWISEWEKPLEELVKRKL